MDKKPSLDDLAYGKVTLWTAGITLLAAIIDLLSKVVNYAHRVPKLRIQI